MNKKVVRALLWLKHLLQEQNISYQIVGGLASNIHGGARSVADIDLYIPKECADKILPIVKNYISKPLRNCVEGSWDLEYFQLIYEEQKIEIGLSPGTKILNKHSDLWVDLNIDYSQSVIGKYEAVEVPVMPVAELIAYKSLLGREVDFIDIEELTRTSLS